MTALQIIGFMCAGWLIGMATIVAIGAWDLRRDAQRRRLRQAEISALHHGPDPELIAALERQIAKWESEATAHE